MVDGLNCSRSAYRISFSSNSTHNRPPVPHVQSIRRPQARAVLCVCTQNVRTLLPFLRRSMRYTSAASRNLGANIRHSEQ